MKRPLTTFLPDVLIICHRSVQRLPEQHLFMKCVFACQVVRIFTSSTFTDMLMERNTLMEWVYPKIKEYCKERHGLEFQVRIKTVFTAGKIMNILGCRHEVGSPRRNDKRAYDHRALHEGASLLSTAFYRSQENMFCPMLKINHAHLI